MTDPERVVLALVALRKRRDTAFLAHRMDPIASARKNLVRIGLVAYVPDDPILGRVVQIM